MSETKAEGEKRVDALLVEPLAGLARKRGMSAETHEKMLGRLKSFLSYMSDENLRGMHDLILRHAVKAVWPDEGLIKHWAFTLQLPPPRDSSYAISLIRSAMGRQAMSEGWAVELFQIAKRIGPPPGKYIIRELKESADKHRRRRGVIEEHIRAGSATKEEQDWLAAWLADLTEIEAIQSAHEDGAAA